MKPGTLVRVVGCLAGVLFAVSVASWGAQQSQILSLMRAQDPQQGTVQPTKLSDEERADIFMVRKSFANAIDYYSRAIKSYHVSAQNRAKVVSLWNKVGICYQQESDYKDARKAYKKAIRLEQPGHDLLPEEES